MIRLRMGAADLQRMRFGYSPLAEVAESLHMINAGQIPEQHSAWFVTVRDRLRRVDMALLRVVVPPRLEMANFMFVGAGPGTTIERQLRLVADYPVAQLRAGLSEVWPGAGLPPAAEKLLADGAGRRLADVLWDYWQAALEPHWAGIRALLDADVAYCAARLADGGIEGMLGSLHPTLKLRDGGIQVGKNPKVTEHELAGAGLLLVPCVFAWPNVVVGVSDPARPHLTYGARGIGNLWHDGPRETPGDGSGPAGGPVTIGEGVCGVLEALAVPRHQIPAGLDAQAGLYRSVLAGRRMLVVLDNVGDEQQVRPLLPGTAGCMVLVTSQGPLPGLAAIEGAHQLTLETMSEAEAVELLAARLGARRVACEPEAASELASLCARQPLALVTAAAWAAARPRLPLTRLFAQLRRRLDQLTVLDPADPATSLPAMLTSFCETPQPGC